MKFKQLIQPISRSIPVASIALILIGGFSYASLQTASPPATVEAPPVEAPSRAGSGGDFADIAAQQGKAVVNISVSGSQRAETRQGVPGFPGLQPDDPFYELFRRFQMPTPRGEEPRHGLGSGFIVRADGVILTNAHVVDDAKEVIVKLADKREFKAKVVGIDKPTDVAVLKIDASGLPTVRIGSAEQARVGEWVVAIGAPFGFENTVTAGIISAKSRSFPDEGYVPFLQTDVAVNPGNSGGPLFNMKGEVIGINSQIYSRSGGYQGLSFAIPIEVAIKVEQQLLDHGKVSRGRLGVMIQEVDQALADSFGLNKPTGALVSSVEKGSPAERAGILAGDVILKFNGKDVGRSSELPPLVADVRPGSSARLEIWRKGAVKTIEMNVGELTASAAKGLSDGDGSTPLGLALRPLTPEELQHADVAEGLMVTDVAEGAAARAGIRPGDAILAVNGEKVGSVRRLRELTTGGEKRLALQILRQNRKMFVALTLD
ncbi:MAG TPA: DegQ family serine endoprotease [Rhodocyclaceae bacterium]|nr:DegQ family serine endoprotease [Rhodocyclaceae bacterium]